jgi:hypothetical protein
LVKNKDTQCQLIITYVFSDGVRMVNSIHSF